MANDNVQIPVPGTVFVSAEPFYDVRVDKALEACQKEHNPVYMPGLVDSRILGQKGDAIWQNWYTSPSVRVTGESKQGGKFVVYAHIPNHFSTGANITAAIDAGLFNGAGQFPKEDFYRLLEMKDDRAVFVVDYDTLRPSSSGVIPVSAALEHPQTIPFLGGQARAESYLKKHEEVYGDKIGIWHQDDFQEGQPFGRVLFLGDNRGSGLDGIYGLSYYARFVGVRRDVVAAGDAQKNVAPSVIAPSLAEILQASEEFVPSCARTAHQEAMAALYARKQ